MGTATLCEHDSAQISVTVFGLFYVFLYARSYYFSYIYIYIYYIIFECWNRMNVEIIDMHG